MDLGAYVCVWVFGNVSLCDYRVRLLDMFHLSLYNYKYWWWLQLLRKRLLASWIIAGNFNMMYTTAGIMITFAEASSGRCFAFCSLLQTQRCECCIRFTVIGQVHYSICQLDSNPKLSAFCFCCPWQPFVTVAVYMSGATTPKAHA